MKKRYWITALIYVVYLALVIGVGYVLPLPGNRFILFCVILAVVGAIAAIVALLYLHKTNAPAVQGDASALDVSNLTALVRSAEDRLKASPGGAKTLASMPLVYILGDENSAKTQTVLQSGLDAELLSGAVFRDGMVVATQLANIWYTPSAVIVEASGALLRQPGLCQRLVSLTQPNRLKTALKKGALQPTRAAILCLSIERVMAANSDNSVRALGQMLNERLRLVSQTLGISLPVYVLFTKLDTIPSFASFATNLTEDEVRQPLGALLARIDAGAGLYAERGAEQVLSRFDELCYSLSEFRIEVLSRGGEPQDLARAYEFPRELRKMRAAIADLLVEIGRPSQLGVNPFLRGFYFSGMRAHLVDDGIAPSAPAQAAAPAPPVDAGATRVFSFSAAQLPSAGAPPVRRGGTRRVPQWAFLPHLFSRVILADRSALDSSRASTRVNFVKRVLIASVAACFFLYLIALTVSYFNNSALESRLRSKSAASLQSVAHGDPASTGDLQQLDQLRQTFAQIAAYRKNGAPLSYRWGLYDSDRLYAAACAAYGSHFQTLLLTPTQSNILSRLSALPAQPQPTDDYTATYNPLRAYLITTSNPEKSTADFLPSTLLQAWVGNHTLPSDATSLALTQFQTYAATLLEPASCMASLGGRPHAQEVYQARAYLSLFQGFNQVYANMKAAANKQFQPIQFTGYAHYVIDPQTVDGAFTKGGYAFMQNAIQHPEPYTGGEQWVLGSQSGVPIDPAVIRAQLPTQYQSDFLDAWRKFLKAATVIKPANFPDAQEKLHQLDSPSSALLELFQMVSINTAVPNDTFSKPFEAPQLVVPPNATNLPKGYVDGLTGLDSAISSIPPGSPPSGAVLQPVTQAAGSALAAVVTVRGGFVPVDPSGYVEKLSEDLLTAPIKNAQDLVRTANEGAAGGGAKALCAQLNPLLNKFPFNPGSQEEASITEVTAAFQPGGAFSQYAQTQAGTITLIGTRYIQAQGASININSAFLNFMSAAQTFSAALFPSGNSPQLSFTLMQESTAGLPPAIVDIDGTSLSAAGQSKSFTWSPAPSSTIRVNEGGVYGPPYTGTWSLFRFAYDPDARHPAPNKLERSVKSGNKQATSQSGVPLVYKYDVGGTGALLLNPAFMSQLHCTTKVAQ